MNRVEELIKEYCPNGVEYKKIADVSKYEQPSKYIVKNTNYDDLFTVPVLTAGQSFILGYTNEQDGIYNASKEDPVIIFDDFTGSFKWVDFPFKVKSSAIKIIRSNNNVLLRYLYHCMSFLNFSSSEHKRLWLRTYSNFKIPVPSLPVQEEIVRTLDTFTKLTSELTSRKKQYEFYRDHLLKVNNEGTTTIRLGDAGKFYGGLTGKSKDDFKDGNAKFITYKNVYSNIALNTDPDETVKIYSEEKQNTLKYGDIVFTGSSETIDECGFSSVVTKEPNENLYLNSFCFFYRFDDLNIIYPDYAKYLFRSLTMRKKIIKSSQGVTRFNVSKKRMENISITLPSLEIQKKIADALNNFDAVCNDLKIGLPAEIEARQKQYEYYRNALLTFAETGNIIAQTDRQNIIRLIQYVFGYVPVRLDEICNIQNGYTPSKKNSSYWENGSFPWFRMDDIRENGRILSDSIQHVTNKAVKGNGFPADSVIFSTSATVGEHALIKTPFICNQRFTVINIKENFKNSIDVKYLFYYGFIIDKLCIENAKDSGTFKSVQTNTFRSFKITLPDIATQKKVVSILDGFDKLNNSIINGLPAEIEARKKQYEYYRNKLLTFNESVK